MSFTDVINNELSGNLTMTTDLVGMDIVEILFVSCLIGLYVYFVYRFMSKAEFYSKDLNISLAALSVIVAAIMIAMQASLIVSLGMVGALSIVRFRTAVKNPMDLVFLFWSISVGIICGVRLYLLAILMSLFITVLIFTLGKINFFKGESVFILNTDEGNSIDEVLAILKKNCKHVHESSYAVTNKKLQVVYSISCKSQQDLMNELNELNKDHVYTFHLLKHDGDQRA